MTCTCTLYVALNVHHIISSQQSTVRIVANKFQCSQAFKVKIGNTNSLLVVLLLVLVLVPAYIIQMHLLLFCLDFFLSIILFLLLLLSKSKNPRDQIKDKMQKRDNNPPHKQGHDPTDSPVHQQIRILFSIL